MIGIYRIIINGKSYVGSSFNIEIRLRQHKSDLSCNRHCNPYLQAAYNKYKTFSTEILETFDNISDAELRKIEKDWKIKIGEYNIQDPETHFGIKEIYQFDLKGNFIKKYNSIYLAAKELDISVSNIRHAAEENEKLTRTAGGYFWRYTQTIDFEPDRRNTKIYLYDIEGNFIKEYDSYRECAEDLKMPQKDFVQAISNICDGICSNWNGYRFSRNKCSKLDNTKLLTIRQNFPVVQISKDGKYKLKVWNCAADAAKFVKCPSYLITQACVKNKTTRGYRWTRLGTKLSELLETPEDIKTKAELKTADAKV